MNPRRLPPLGALRAFEAAARLASFKRAADELAVTPTAISHQIRLLEDQLGVRLFERRTRQVALTADAAQLYPVLREGFDAFAAAVAAIAARRARRAITLSATVSFTAKWLVPRVAAFRAAYPDFDLRLHASDDPVDLHAGVADAAIRYGHGPYPGLICLPLIDDVFAPVCSPRLGVRVPADLRSQPLLHVEWRHPAARTPSWRGWCERADLRGVEVDAGLRYTDDSHAIQAAIAGQGVALLSLALVADDLASGLLVQPFGPSLEGYRHNLVYPDGGPPGAEVAALRDWLLAQVAGDGPGA
ncbi:LysR family transcriptional regulator [Lysobacter sp. Root667]|uniref:transcriptional regulator GcvA n=1 Tax=Lysobacter sp. Root667 TaxID=1736581 RepID=UPI0006F21B0E|nr:transcriptional regulator GcvA [Lysobacter sp. Root667]KRA81895.1 LysR family transcriptional regulator [Lysobacter sp. Root667]